MPVLPEAAMSSLLEQAIQAFRQRVLASEADQMREMARRWLEVEYALQAQVTLLAEKTAAMRAAGETVSAAKIYRLEHYQRLLAQAKAQVQMYSHWAADLITRQQSRMTQLGIEGAVAAIRAAYLDAGQIGAYFDLLPVEAIETMVGLAGDGTPLYKLLIQDYAETIQEITQILVDSTALGRNPRDTARLMLEAFGGNLDRSLTTARTEQLRAYRQASRQQMAASGVVEGYIRRCALNPRTCMACIVLDGTEYPTDKLMDVHPNDRCFMQPKIKGLEPVQVESGQAWFLRQAPETQRDMMGPKYYDAWRSGDFQLSQLASTHVDDTWGPTVQVTPLSELTQ
jgi:hypothetical protein